ncbi:MAG TPA: galactose-1-phosphate uridylyltransferase [Syntrophomonadaceae bacterium]|nr:galactose-1-phosphate uridylyltransferase [Syntrophomonadaceae bacterium]
MPELRQEPVTKKWVIIATERSKRPSDFPVKQEERKGGICPFCKGNENLTPPEIISYREPETKPNEPGWWIRVVPNKFPALQRERTENPPKEDFYTVLPGTGAHEVIIEASEHDTSLERQSLSQLVEIFRSWRERHNHLMNEDEIKYVQIFKNEGAVAGASLQHPHSQVIAVPLIPDVIAEELDGAQKFYREKKNCIYCEINQVELNRNTRIVEENDGFIAYCPFASRFPFETWVVPKQHKASFSGLDDSLLRHLSSIIKETISKITTSLNHPPYNLILHTAPAGYQDAPYYHWHMEILPRLTIVAGFEWGTGIYINPTPPEAAASYLREIKAIH